MKKVNRAIIEAQKFILKSPDGKVKAILDASSKKATPRLVMYGKNGEVRLAIGILHDNVALVQIYDKKEKAQVVIHVAGSGLPRIEFYDKKRKLVWAVPE